MFILAVRDSWTLWTVAFAVPASPMSHIPLAGSKFEILYDFSVCGCLTFSAENLGKLLCGEDAGFCWCLLLHNMI